MPRTLLCTDCDETFPHKEGETRCPSCGFGRIVDADEAELQEAYGEKQLPGARGPRLPEVNS